MENSGGIKASLAGRYASALFDLSVEQNALEKVEQSLVTLTAAMDQSADLSALVNSPLVSRGAAGKAIGAVAGVLGIDSLTARFLGVLAQNRRLADLPAMIRAFGQLAAAHRGEVTADVTSAHPLTDDQIVALKAQLRARVGRDVAISTKVDPAILGGLVVKLGSQLIDGSIRTRLNSFASAMKG